MTKYDTETIKALIKLAIAREASEAQSFLTEFLETLVEPKEFERFLEEIERS
jgi:hypothetical protein